MVSETGGGKKHSIWLYVYLCLYLVANIRGVYVYIFNHDSLSEFLWPNYKIWMSYLFVSLCLLNIAFVVLIWKRNQIGFYGIVATALVDMGFDVYFGLPFLLCIKSIVNVIILFFLLRWKPTNRSFTDEEHQETLSKSNSNLRTTCPFCGTEYIHGQDTCKECGFKR